MLVQRMVTDMATEATHTLAALAQALQALTPQHQPLWGRMQAQLMVEHMAQTLRISNGHATATLLMPESKLPILRKQLLSDMPLPHNFQNPTATDVLHYDNLGQAQAALLQELQAFEHYFAAHPEATPVHPIYGPLNKAEWQCFHTKHFTHHIEQFGLLPMSQ